MELATEDPEEGEKRRKGNRNNRPNIILRCRRNGYLISCLILALLSGFTYSFNVIERGIKSVFGVSDIFLSVLYPLGILALVMSSLIIDKIRRLAGLKGSIFAGAIIAFLGFLTMGLAAHLASIHKDYTVAFVCLFTISFLCTNLGLGFGYYMGFKVLIDYTHMRSTTLSMSIFTMLFLSGNVFFLEIKEVFKCKTLHGFLYASSGVAFILFSVSIFLLRKPDRFGGRRISDSETTIQDKKRKPKPNWRELKTKPIILCFLLSFFIVGWVQFSYNFNSELIREYSGDNLEGESIKNDLVSFLSSTSVLLLIGTTLDILETKGAKNKSLVFILVSIIFLFFSSFVSIFLPEFMVTNYLSSMAMGISGSIFILLPKCFTDFTDNKNITMAMGIGDFLGFIGTLVFNLTPSLISKRNSSFDNKRINRALFITMSAVCYILIVVMMFILFRKKKECRKS